jgi:hypothetical protein
MTVEELLDMEPKMFFYKFEGYMDHQNWLQREEYERMRLLATALLQVHVKKNKQLKPKDIFKFEWDQEKVVEPVDPEHAKKMMKIAHIEGKLLI